MSIIKTEVKLQYKNHVLTKSKLHCFTTKFYTIYYKKFLTLDLTPN